MGDRPSRCPVEVACAIGERGGIRSWWHKPLRVAFQAAIAALKNTSGTVIGTLNAAFIRAVCDRVPSGNTATQQSGSYAQLGTDAQLGEH